MADGGTSYAIDISARAESAQTAAGQLETLASRLDTASSAADAATAAVKAGETAYRQAETAYDRSAKVLERINVAMQSASGPTLDRLVGKQAEAAAAVEAARAALDQETAALDQLKTAAAAADSELANVTQAHADAKRALDDQAKSQAATAQMNEVMSSSLSKIGGPLGALGGKVFGLKGAWDKMGKTLGAGGPYLAVAAGVTAIAAAVIACGVAAVKATVEFAKWAVGLADVARTNTLLAAGMVQSAAGGAQLSAVIDDMTKAFPATREEISGMAAELAKTGLRGKALYAELERTAQKAAETKFGPEWQAQMISLDQSQKRLKAGITGIFSGLNIEKLLAGIASLVDLFDESTATGRAAKVVFESLFQPLIDGATGMLPKLRTAFIQFEIMVLKALIAMKPWGSTLLTVGKVIAVVSAAILGGLVLALGLVVGLIAAMAAVLVFPIALFAALAAGVVYVGLKIFEFGKFLVTTFQNMSLVSVGQALIEGLAKGVTAGANAVIGAVTSAADGAITAAKKALGIASPSKVFAEIGMQTAAGMVGGVDAGAGDVEAAVGALVAPPPVLPAVGGAAAPAAPAAAAGGNTFYITVAGGGPLDAALLEQLRQLIVDCVEGAVVQIGAAAAPATGGA